VAIDFPSLPTLIVRDAERDPENEQHRHERDQRSGDPGHGTHVSEIHL